jgi:hypothetical protein
VEGCAWCGGVCLVPGTQVPGAPSAVPCGGVVWLHFATCSHAAAKFMVLTSEWHNLLEVVWVSSCNMSSSILGCGLAGVALGPTYLPNQWKRQCS